MPSHHETILVPYSAAQMFALVTDVEKYPEFLPWCAAARVLCGDEAEKLAELVISFQHLRERYTSRIITNYPNEIKVSLVEGPFDKLDNHWRFIDQPNGCAVEFFLDFKFRSFLLEKMIGGIFKKAVEKMTSAFLTRAEELYGK